MQPIRLRVLVTCLIVLLSVLGGWKLVGSDRPGGAIAVGTTDAVTSLDPAGAYDAGSWALFGNVYQSLLTFRPGELTPVPDAARECHFAGMNLQTYVCELRNDLSFADGRRITAEDVAHSFTRLLRISADTGPHPLFATLRSAAGEGQTVVFTLRSHDATFPLKLATGAGSIVDRTTYPGGSLRKGTSVNGSGPYVLGEYEAGVRALLVPNPRYRGAVTRTGGPVEIRYFDRSDRLAAAWKGGRLHVVHRELPPRMIADLTDGGPGVRTTEAGSAEIRSLVFNLRAGSPMAEPAVRRAVAWTVDRSELSLSAYRSTVQPLYSLIPQGILAHSNPFFDSYPEPSPARARGLLDDAGVRAPVSFTLAHRAGTGQAAEAAVLKRQLERTGLFRVTLRAEKGTAFQKGYADGRYDAYTVGWIPDFPDPDSFCQPLVGTGSALHNGYRSRAVDELIAASRRHRERARATGDFRALQRQIAKDVPLLPLWQKKEYVLSTGDVRGSQYLSDGTGLWRLWELSRM